MAIGDVLAAILVGLVVGVAGRLVPARAARVSRTGTLVCGLVGAGLGLVVGVAFSTTPVVVAVFEIAGALLLVWGYASLQAWEHLHRGRRHGHP